MIYIGIDPGQAGGIAALSDGGAVIRASKMPETPADLIACLDAILSYRSVEGPATAILERVSASPQMGVVSAFTFGKGYGGLLVLLAAARVPFDEVSPVRWQNVMQCRTRGDKNVSKRRAQQLFPAETITHAIADALLLAEYGRRCDVSLRKLRESMRNIGAGDDGKKEDRKDQTAGQQKPTQRAAQRRGHPEGGRGI